MGFPVGRPKSPHGRKVSVQTYVDPVEDNRIRDAADRAHLDVSTWVRQTLIRRLDQLDSLPSSDRE